VTIATNYDVVADSACSVGGGAPGAAPVIAMLLLLRRRRRRRRGAVPHRGGLGAWRGGC